MATYNCKAKKERFDSGSSPRIGKGWSFTADIRIEATNTDNLAENCSNIEKSAFSQSITSIHFELENLMVSLFDSFACWSLEFWLPPV